MPEENQESKRPSTPQPPSVESNIPPAPPIDIQPVKASSWDKQDYEKKLGELEKRLLEEREKLLRANIKSQEEAATSSRIEISLRELQEKLRRDRREQEQEERRLKLESKIQELEARLAQERETWVATLKNQLQSRDTQDKEIETHFAQRLQETERRALEEKAQWQKLMLAKDEEIRNLRSLAEKLKGVDGDLSKTLLEKKWLESRLSELNQERAEAQAKIQLALERERELIQLRAEFSMARQQASMVQERFEYERQALRRELEAATLRLRPGYEAEIHPVDPAILEAGKKYKEAAERSGLDLQRLKGVCGALEKQVASYRAQLLELESAKSTWQKTQEQHKAEIEIIKQKWSDREKELIAEFEAQAAPFKEELDLFRRQIAKE